VGMALEASGERMQTPQMFQVNGQERDPQMRMRQKDKSIGTAGDPDRSSGQPGGVQSDGAGRREVLAVDSAMAVH
jgi:hypothetical protein